MPENDFNPDELKDYSPQLKKPDGSYESRYAELTYDIEHEFVELGKLVDTTKIITAVLDNGKTLARVVNFPLPEPKSDYFYFEPENNRIWIDPSYVGQSITVSFYEAGDVVRNSDVDNIADSVERIQQYLTGPQREFLDKYSKYKDQFENWEQEYSNLLPLPRQIHHMQQQIDYILKMLRDIGNIGTLGIPSDGSYDDGYLGGVSPIRLFPSDTVANGVDKLNEALREVSEQLRLCYQPEFSNINWQGTYASGVVYANNVGFGLVGGSPATVVKTGTPIIFNSKIKSGVRYIFYADKNNDQIKESWEIPIGQTCDYPNKAEKIGDIMNAKVTNPEQFLGIFKTPYNGDLEVVFKTENLSDGYSTLRVSFRDSKGNIVVQQSKSFFLENDISVDYNPDNVNMFISNTQFKYLSGIAYLKDADFEFELPTIKNLVQYTVKQYPVNVRLNSLGLVGNVSYTQLWGKIPNAWDSLFSKNFSFSLPQNKMRLSTDTVKLSFYNVFSISQQSFNFPYWVNNISCESSWLEEKFCTETYRLPLDNYNELPTPAKDVWDSTQSLTDEAIVYSGKLVHPNYIGSIQTAPEYSYSLSSSQQFVDYIRMFKGSEPRNNGILQLTGDFIFGTNLKAYIKLPGQTGWLDLSKYYDLGTFTGADDDGAATKFENISGGVKVNWTAGTNSTAYTDYSYVIKISISDGCYLDNIKEIGW
jgi:hypothetical protein